MRNSFAGVVSTMPLSVSLNLTLAPSLLLPCGHAGRSWPLMDCAVIAVSRRVCETQRIERTAFRGQRLTLGTRPSARVVAINRRSAL